MNLSDIPRLVKYAFAQNAGAGYSRQVPVESQQGIAAGKASFNDGFPPDTFKEIDAGGSYMNGEDLNGVLNHVSNWTRWQSAGGSVKFDAGFCAAIGGYPRDCVLSSSAGNGVFWSSTVDGNMTDPDGPNPVGWRYAGPNPSTKNDVLAGTDGTSFISPAVLAAAFTGVSWDPSTGGVINLPGGVTVQFGQNRLRTNQAGTLYTTNFVVPFAEPAWNVQMMRCLQTPGERSSYNQKYYGRTGLTTESLFQWKVWQSDSGDSQAYVDGFDWLAIGKTAPQ